MKYVVIFLAAISSNALAQQFNTAVLANRDRVISDPLPLKRYHTFTPYGMASWQIQHTQFASQQGISNRGGSLALGMVPLIFLAMGTGFAISDGMDSSGAIVGSSGFILTGSFTYVKYIRPRKRQPPRLVE
jgi:hypothetical protein